MDETATPSPLAAAEAHYRAGRLIEAEAACRSAHSGEAGAAALLGDILLAADRNDEAEAAFRDALAAVPADGPSLDGLALTLFAQGRTEEAGRTFALSWAWQATPGTAAIGRALTALEAGRWQAAEAEYATALQLEARQERTMRDVFLRAYQALAERLLASGEVGAALVLLLRLIDFTDEAPTVRDRLAAVLLAAPDVAALIRDLPREQSLALLARLAAAHNRSGAGAPAEATLLAILDEALALVAREPASACWRGLLDALNSFPDHGRARALLAAGLRRRRSGTAVPG